MLPMAITQLGHATRTMGSLHSVQQGHRHRGISALGRAGVWGAICGWRERRSATLFALLWMWLPPLALQIFLMRFGRFSSNDI